MCIVCEGTDNSLSSGIFYKKDVVCNDDSYKKLIVKITIRYNIIFKNPIDTHAINIGYMSDNDIYNITDFKFLHLYHVLPKSLEKYPFVGMVLNPEKFKIDESILCKYCEKGNNVTLYAVVVSKNDYVTLFD